MSSHLLHIMQHVFCVAERFCLLFKWNRQQILPEIVKMQRYFIRKLWFFSHWVPVYSNCLQLIRFNKHFCSSIILYLNLTFQCTHLRISHNLNNWTVDQHFLSKYESPSRFLSCISPSRCLSRFGDHVLKITCKVYLSI